MSRNAGMSIEMYDFIINNKDRLNYDLVNGLVITPKNTNGSKCSSTGYLRVKVNKKTLQVHQIMAVIYFGNKCIGKQINHIDGNKLNNRVDNLEPVSQKENLKHAIDNGLYGRVYEGETNTSSKLKEFEVREILLNIDSLSERKLAMKYNVSKSLIHNILHRRNWKHISTS